MKNDEMRALVDKMEQLAPILQQGGQLSAGYMLDRARTAIEALLARQDEHEAEIARLTTILYGKPIAAPEISEVAVGPLMSVPQFFGMLNELRNSAQLTEATASAELAKETKNGD